MPKREYAPGESRGKTEEERKARNAQADAWDRENTWKIMLKLNRHTDVDVIVKITEEAVFSNCTPQAAIKKLIRIAAEAMKKESISE